MRSKVGCTRLHSHANPKRKTAQTQGCPDFSWLGACSHGVNHFNKQPHLTHYATSCPNLRPRPCSPKYRERTSLVPAQNAFQLDNPLRRGSSDSIWRLCLFQRPAVGHSCRPTDGPPVCCSTYVKHPDTVQGVSLTARAKHALRSTCSGRYHVAYGRLSSSCFPNHTGNHGSSKPSLD